MSLNRWCADILPLYYYLYSLKQIINMALYTVQRLRS